MVLIQELEKKQQQKAGDQREHAGDHHEAEYRDEQPLATREPAAGEDVAAD